MTPRFPPAIGGMENHVYAISTELKKRGHDVIVITSDDVDEGWKCTVEHMEVVSGVEIYRRSLLFGKRMREFWFLSDIAAILGEVKADVVHTNGYRCMSSCIATRWCRKNRTPVVLTAHGIYPPRSFGNLLVKFVYDRTLGNALLKSSTRVTALTEHNRQLLMKLGASEDKIVLIPNGVDVRNHREVPRESENKQKERFAGPVLLYVGRIDWNKGLERVLEALPALKKEFDEIRFLIVGPDYAGYSKNLSDLARKLRISDLVVMTGEVSEEKKLLYYSIADVFILPALYEGMSLSLLEAMANHVPVIASASGGPGDILVDHVHALLLKNCSPVEIYDSVNEVLHDRRLATKVQQNAFNLVLEKFSWTTVVNRIEALYSEVCSKN